MEEIPRLQNAGLGDKIVLLRVDHNVVKKGRIKDPYRIDASLETIRHIFDQGAKPIIMTHIGRPKDKQSGRIEIDSSTAVEPVAEYLSARLNRKFLVPQLAADGENGIARLELTAELQQLHTGKYDGIYLPNTRWFSGEEAKDEKKVLFGRQLAGLADIFVNDAFGSWQPHASTVEPARYLPSFAGFLMQREIDSLNQLFQPERPLVAVIAGAKFDTKIGPLQSLLQLADYLVLGGVIYNAYLAARYNFTIQGVSPEDLAAARNFLNQAGSQAMKILELPLVVESRLPDAKQEGQFKTIDIRRIPRGSKLHYILDASPASFQEPLVQKTFSQAATFFVNAVMGFTPHFTAGTIALDLLIDQNRKAVKLFGGGDTLQEFKTLLPDVYDQALNDRKYYFFTGGGTILTAIEQGSALGLEPVQALIRNRGMKP